MNGKMYKFKAFNCTNQVYHTARKTNTTCYNNTAEIIEIGFKLNDNQFVHLMNVCYDQILQRTWYSHYVLTPETVAFQKSFPRTNFIQGKFFGRAHINDLYKMKSQRKILQEIFGESRMKAIFNGTDMNLARGHLSAKVYLLIFFLHKIYIYFFFDKISRWITFMVLNNVQHFILLMLHRNGIVLTLAIGNQLNTVQERC